MEDAKLLNKDLHTAANNILDVEPSYPDVHCIGSIFGKHITWEADGWKAIGESYFKAAYIHAGLSGAEETFKGPDAEKLLSDFSINDVTKWTIGKCKHLVSLTPDGYIANHALFWKAGPDEFHTTAGCSVPYLAGIQSGKYDVQYTTKPIFIFQLSGPLSLTIVEKATQEDLHSVKFLQIVPTHIPGIDADLEFVRIGMSGTLSYEVHGPASAGPAVYDKLYQIGKPMGLKRMGWKDYTINHTFGGNPQITVNFESSLYADPDFTAKAPFVPNYTGSIDPKDLKARFRTPVECRWNFMARFNHDFVGREALEKEIAHPVRRVVSLELNPDDIAEVIRSQFTDDPYKYIDFPCAEPQPAGGHQDHVTDQNGKEIGISANPTYSSHYKVMISHAVINVEEIEEGREVIIKWGDFGGKIKDIRATIRPFPYIRDVEDNKTYDLSSVPSGLSK